MIKSNMNFKEKGLSGIIISRPHITEKASNLAEKGAYVFVVNKRANKLEIKEAIKELYKVTPVKINIINVPSKQTGFRGRKGVKSGYKKAIVYLEEGDKIETI